MFCFLISLTDWPPEVLGDGRNDGIISVAGITLAY